MWALSLCAKPAAVPSELLRRFHDGVDADSGRTMLMTCVLEQRIRELFFGLAAVQRCDDPILSDRFQE